MVCADNSKTEAIDECEVHNAILVNTVPKTPLNVHAYDRV